MTASLTGETEALFTVLRQSADSETVAAIEHFVAEAPDRALCRINPIAFAAQHHLDEERVIGAFLHAARLGIFELSWNVLCPGCGGVLEANTTLKSVHSEEYVCAWCAAGYEPTLDEIVEVTFTITRRVRRIAGHEPDELPFFEYFRQIFWASGVDLPDDLEALAEKLTLDTLELPSGEKAQLSLQLPAEFLIVMEPVTHAAQFLEVKGEPTRERQNMSLVFNDVIAPTGTVALRPGPLRLSLENRTRRRLLPGVWIAGEALRRIDGAAPSVPDRQAAVDQPDFSRHLPHRHARCRSAAQDHKPDLPVHRPQGLDRAVQPGRRPRRLRSGAGAFPSAERDRCGRGRRRRQNDRRRRHGDISDTGPGGGRGAAHAGGDAGFQHRAWPGGSAAEDRHPRGAVPRGRAQ